MKDYLPAPIDTGEVDLPPELVVLSEKIARNTHEVWAAARIKDGWSYGACRNDVDKQTPCLVPYELLPESEKEYDRKTAESVLKLVVKLGFKISKV